MRQDIQKIKKMNLKPEDMLSKDCNDCGENYGQRWFDGDLISYCIKCDASEVVKQD